MTNLESLRSLQKRIREAKGADRELDWIIANTFKVYRDVFAMGASVITHLDAPNFTLDPDGLGPCVALLDAVLPGAEFELNTIYGLAYVNLPLNAAEDETMQFVRRDDGNKCLAFCDAIVSTLIAKEEAKVTT